MFPSYSGRCSFPIVDDVLPLKWTTVVSLSPSLMVRGKNSEEDHSSYRLFFQLERRNPFFITSHALVGKSAGSVLIVSSFMLRGSLSLPLCRGLSSRCFEPPFTWQAWPGYFLLNSCNFVFLNLTQVVYLRLPFLPTLAFLG